MEKISRRSLLKASAGTAAFISIAGPSTISFAADDALERVKKAGVLRVAFANEAPFAYKAEDGTLTGSEVEILRAIFKEAGVENLEGVVVDFGSLIPSLIAGRVDVIGAGAWIRPERCEQIDFSSPTYSTGEAIWVKKGNPHGLRSFRDIAEKNVNCAFIVGSAELVYADVAGIAADKRVILSSYETAVAALQANRVECVVQLAMSAHSLFDRLNDPELELITELSEDPIDQNGKPVRNYGAAGFRKADQSLRDFYDAQLATLRSSGRQLELMAPFGFTEHDLPPADLTAAQVCAG